MNPKLDNYFDQSTIPSDAVLDERREEVLLHICEMGVSFPTEMARACDLNIESVNRIVYDYKKKGFIDRITPNKTDPQPVFRTIIPAMWARGITGFDSFVRFSWWTLTESGFEFIKVKYKNQHKPIRGSLCTMLGLVEEEVKHEERSGS